MRAVIAHTDPTWFDNLSRLATRDADGPLRLDEAFFWHPKATIPLRGDLQPGEPIFFRLGAPTRAIAGYGFYAGFLRFDAVHVAWDAFGPITGAATLSELIRLLKRDLSTARQPLYGTVLRDAVFWPDHAWLPWGTERGYARSGLARGRTDDDPANVHLLLATIAGDHTETPRDLITPPEFVPLDGVTPELALTRRKRRVGQRTFRARLLDHYRGQCAVTREHTRPVLAAAHIQPYVGPESNHRQNGLILTQEFHTLFDSGLVTVEPPSSGRDTYRLEVSDLLQELWNNGKRYKEYRGRELAVPEDPALRPSVAALDWHRSVVFEKVELRP